ncbi:hypothetical protein PHYC_01743 [Phycisphaerales bacterium]|nr:hypothetical protein PHYC_01743 [Phycisphaerales bacterium]
MRSSPLLPLATLVIPAAPALADITPIPAFVGELREPVFHPTFLITNRIPFFGGAADMVSYNGTSTVVHLISGSTFAGDPVTPRTGTHILGVTQGPMILEFHTPLRRFGAYFNNNSGVSNASAEFFAGASSLGTRTVVTPAPGNVWTWNGWESDTPITRMVITGQGTLNGFLWTDDLEGSTIPAPEALTLPMTGMGLTAARRSRAKR